MGRLFAIWLVTVVYSSTGGWAGPTDDCTQENDLDRSISGCTELIESSKNSSTVAQGYTSRGIAYGKKGDCDRAIADFNKAIEIEAKNARAYESRGVCYTRKDDLDRAIADFNKVIDIDPQARVYLNRGAAYGKKGDYDRAIADYTKAIDIDPNFAIAYKDRGVSHARKGDYDRAIADYTKAIDIGPKFTLAYNNRGIAHQKMGDYDRAIADYTKAIDIDPKSVGAYINRGVAYVERGDYDRAIADYTKAIDIDPKSALAYSNRGRAYVDKGDNDRAIADLTTAIGINPKDAPAYSNRGSAYANKGDFDRAITDLNKACEIDPKLAGAHARLGRVHLRQGDVDRAIADLSEAMRLAPKDPEWVVERGEAYEAKGQIERAIRDYRVALGLPARTNTERQSHDEARRRLRAIESRKQPTEPQPVTTSALPAPSRTGRRVALVIGNANYGNAGQLHNPVNDGRAIAASLRRLGFAEVVERYDLGQVPMIHALKEFGDKVALSDWAVVFYSGHGMEMNGVAYLIPVDAKLERDTHVDDEAVPLQRVLDKVGSAQKLRLVILDACRNNPFVARMVRRGGVTRSIGRGLAPVEPEGGVLVAYAAKHGTTAEDGTGTNSPFTEALVASLEEPGLEIGFLFRKVRDKVLTKTARRQEPYLYGSLPNEGLYFKP